MGARDIRANRSFADDFGGAFGRIVDAGVAPIEVLREKVRGRDGVFEGNLGREI
jgi:hypothetical protein